METSQLVNNEFYQNHVVKVYNIIASHFDKTRAYLWKGVKNFVLSQNTNSLILDVGCGNGKNMFRNDCFFIGLDNSYEMINICQKKKLEVGLNSITNLSFRDGFVDACMCIAVIHHLESNEKRLKALTELVRVTKIGGEIYIQVWDNNLENRNLSKYQKINDDNSYLVKWTDVKTLDVYYRYYYLFSYNEINELIQSLNNVEILNFHNECNNWVIHLKKMR